MCFNVKIMYPIRKVNSYLIFIILIIFGVFQYGINKICGFMLVPDEFGYWASAARAVGYDWSAVASLGSYYSFGYSFLLIPVLKLFEDGVAAYRAAITVNMLLMCASAFLMLGIQKRMFPHTDETKQILISGIAVLYPSWIFYMQMTMTEALLMFLFVLIVYLFICLMQNMKVTTAAFMAAALIYTYCVHMRTVGVLVACVITLIFWMALEQPKVKPVLIFWGVLLLFIVLAILLKRNTIMEVFANADAKILAGNDYGSQWGKIQRIFTISGIWQFLKEAAAKVFYLGLASFGIFYWGMRSAVKKTFSLIKKCRKRQKTGAAEWAALFLLLSAVSEILISSIFMYQGGTIDTLIYGRYNDFLVPVFLMVGIIAMSRSRWLFRGTLIMGTATGMFIPVILNMIEDKEFSGIRGYMVAGISYLLKEDNPNIYLFFRDTWMLGFGVMLLMAFFVWLAGKSRYTVWFLAVIIVLEIAAGLQISHHYTYKVNSSNFMDLCIAEEIRNHIGPEGRVVYLDEGKPEYIDFLQMQLGEKSIEVIFEGDMISENDKMPEYIFGDDQELFLITYIDSQYQNQLEKQFDKCFVSNTFKLYYNIKEDA